jgi:hypothetical protein
MPFIRIILSLVSLAVCVGLRCGILARVETYRPPGITTMKKERNGWRGWFSMRSVPMFG